MIDNAITYFYDLKAQGVDDATARLHTQQRFGIPSYTLSRRLEGYVADPPRARAALAKAATWRTISKARLYLTGETFWERDDADEIAAVLCELYEAITGEAIWSKSETPDPV